MDQNGKVIMGKVLYFKENHSTFFLHIIENMELTDRTDQHTCYKL